MNHRVPTVLLVAVTAVVAGCGLVGSGGADAVGVKSTATTTSGLGDATRDAAGEATPDATESSASGLPDPCTLLTKGDVRDLTGRDVSEVDTDGAEAGAAVRYCQWQQSGGQLAVFLASTTEADFDTTTVDATPVDGVGDKAAELAGHLYVLYGTVQFDVYVRGADDAGNLATAKKIVDVLMDRI